MAPYPIIVSLDSLKEIFGRLRVELKFSTAQHPQTDGQTERTHRTIGQILRSMVNHRQNNWEDILPLCEFAYNDMTHGSTQSSPFFLNYGQHQRSAEDISLSVERHSTSSDAFNWIAEKKRSIDVAKDSLQEAMIRQATSADRHRQERRFEAGQRVLVHWDHIGSRGSDGHPCAKLRRKWFGPFFVSEVISPTTVKLSLPTNIRVNPVFNVDVIKLYVESEEDDEEVVQHEEG